MRIHCFSHLLLLLLRFCEKFVRAPTSAFIALACCSCTLVKFSIIAFLSFCYFSIPNKDNLIRSPSSSPSSGLALLRFFLRSVQAPGLMSCPGNSLFLDSVASDLAAEVQAVVPDSATCLHPRTAASLS